MPHESRLPLALREATSASHRALEQLLRLDDPALTDARRYGQVLRGFGVFLSAWEPRVRTALPPDLHAWFDERSRLAMLERDLAQLGLHMAGADAPAGPPIDLGFERGEAGHVADDDAGAGDAADAEASRIAAAFGSLYVLEGSALGGQVIARQVEATLGYTAGHGAAYFHGWGRASGMRWADFRARLVERVPDEAPLRDRACEAAVRTFDALNDTFVRVLDERRVAA